MLYARYMLLILCIVPASAQTESFLQQYSVAVLNKMRENKLATGLALSGVALLATYYAKPHFFSRDYWWGPGSVQPNPAPVAPAQPSLASVPSPQVNTASSQVCVAPNTSTTSPTVIPLGSTTQPSSASASSSPAKYTPSAQALALKTKQQLPVVASSSQVGVAPKSSVKYKPASIVAENKAKILAQAVLKQKVETPIQQPEVTDDETTFKALVAKSDELFYRKLNNSMTLSNKIKNIAHNNPQKKVRIGWQAKNVRPIIHAEVARDLIYPFLEYKKKHGSAIEQELYANMALQDFIDRLLVNRPLMFLGRSDKYLLRDGKTRGAGGFEDIGTDKEKAPLLLKDYLSYDEMAIAALLGVSTPTFFINKGDRNNGGILGDQGTFQEEGVYIGLVGARFEKPGVMEYSHMLLDSSQNKPENGYGQNPADSPKARLLKIWANFYGLPYFKTFQEAQQDTTGRYQSISGGRYLLDTQAYKKRLAMVLEPFFYDANRRGEQYQQDVYCHMVGLGIGVWAVDNTVQEKLFFETCVTILQKNKFPRIKDVDFSWFNTLSANRAGKLDGINLKISKRDPAAKLTGPNDANKLLVAMYAWDGNAYPGNEYWVRDLGASGDPAAACCSTIAELQNPLINDNVSHKTLRMY